MGFPIWLRSDSSLPLEGQAWIAATWTTQNGIDRPPRFRCWAERDVWDAMLQTLVDLSQTGDCQHSAEQAASKLR